MLIFQYFHLKFVEILKGLYFFLKDWLFQTGRCSKMCDYCVSQTYTEIPCQSEVAREGQLSKYQRLSWLFKQQLTLNSMAILLF